MRHISLLLCLFLIGCSPAPLVKIPVPVQPTTFSIPAKPVLPLSQLTDKSTPAQVINAYIESVKILIIDNEDLRKRLNN